MSVQAPTPHTDHHRTVLEVVDLAVTLDPSGTVIDDEVRLELRAGEVLALVGESASGKTSAATSLLAQQRRGAAITGGSVVLNGTDILALSAKALRSVRGAQIAYVPQDASASLNPFLRIGKQLREVLDAHHFGSGKLDRQNRLAQMLDEVRLPSNRNFLRRYPHQLSGGQQQRVAIAMALACRPSVVVFDEPTSALDVTTQAHVLATVRELTMSSGVASLYVSHDLAVIANLADRVAVMYGGRIVETATRQDLFDNPRHPYTRRLIAAIPTLDESDNIRGIPGRAPRPGDRPNGCSFAPRCELATDECWQTPPPETAVSDDATVRCWNWENASPRVSVRVSSATTDASGAPALTAEGGDVTIHHLTAGYNGRDVLHDVSLELRPHECVALVGESGSGKTTLARCVAGLHRAPYGGAVSLMGTELAYAARDRKRSERKSIQYIFQSPYSSLNPRRTIRMTLSLPLRQFFVLSSAEREARMVDALDQVSLDASVLARYPEQLSGGERQRVAIARALVAEPSVLICDEVTSSLDVSVQASIIELLVQLQRDLGISMLFVTHNLALIRSVSHEVAVMQQGRLIELGPVDSVLTSPSAEYTQRLLADTPVIPN